MKPSRSLTLVTLLALGLTPVVSWAQRSDILPSNRRQPSVEEALKVVHRAELEALPEDLNNPFFPNSLKAPSPAAPTESGEPVEPVYRGPISHIELLETVAPQITPTGTMTLGGIPLLLFGQKKVQMGDKLPILFEGENYTLTISAIEGPNFTLKLGDAELTRPIKSAK